MSETKKNETEKKNSKSLTWVLILVAAILIVGLILICVRCNGDDQPTTSTTDATTTTAPSDSTSTELPTTELPTTEPPTTEPPTTEPPATEPPTTEPPTTEPPTTKPPTTEPPTTEPPTTEPPTTEPPTTEPPTTEPPTTEPPAPEPPTTDTARVDNATDLRAALADPDITTIIFDANITLDDNLVISRDVTFDLNGKTIKPSANAGFPNPRIFTVDKDCTVTVKNGKIVDNAKEIDSGDDFIKVSEGATLNLDNVDVAITLTAMVYKNNTMNRWQTNSATHRIFVVGNGATLKLNGSDISVVSPKTQNFNNYVRYKFSIVGVHLTQNGQNTQFVMDGGSFSIQITDPNAVKSTADYTDTIYFVKSERVTNTNANASNTVTLKGNAMVTIGGPDEAGKIQTNNNLFYLGAGYSGGKTYYSGIKTVSVAPGVEVDLDGVLYSMNTVANWDLEYKCQALGSSFANGYFDNVEEVRYHFVCSNCGYSTDYTLSEVPAKCPVCGKSSLVAESR